MPPSGSAPADVPLELQFRRDSPRRRPVEPSLAPTPTLRFSKNGAVRVLCSPNQDRCVTACAQSLYQFGSKGSEPFAYPSFN
jgi:hypothetical protein